MAKINRSQFQLIKIYLNFNTQLSIMEIQRKKVSFDKPIANDKIRQP